MTGVGNTQFDRRITILRSSPVDDGFTRKDGPFAPWKLFWAGKLDVSDGERLRAAQEGTEISTRFTLRYSSEAATIGGTDKILYHGQTYNIVGTKEVVGRQAEIEITANATRGATT